MEYANGDPTLATKANVRFDSGVLERHTRSHLQALTGTHPMARFMKGDGNCGWRGKLPLRPEESV